MALARQGAALRVKQLKAEITELEKIFARLPYRDRLEDSGDVKPFRPYLLRHSYATLLRQHGADLADVQETLGHKSPKTTARYASVVPARIVNVSLSTAQRWSTPAKNGKSDDDWNAASGEYGEFVVCFQSALSTPPRFG